jgi:hypothetical protein
MKEFSQKSPGNKGIPAVPQKTVKEAEMVENKTVSDGTNETTSQSRQLAVRFAAELVARIEADAAAQNASPTEIVRSIVFEHYSGAGERAALMREIRDLIEDRFRHIVYEISRTRASLYRIAEESPGIELSTEALRDIFEITRGDARIYIDKLEAEIRRRLGPLPTNGKDSGE